MYECACGFQAGTALAFQRHLDRAMKDDTVEQHRLVLPASGSPGQHAAAVLGNPRYSGAYVPGSASFLHLDPVRAAAVPDYVRQYVVNEGSESAAGAAARSYFSAAAAAGQAAGGQLDTPGRSAAARTSGAGSGRSAPQKEPEQAYLLSPVLVRAATAADVLEGQEASMSPPALEKPGGSCRGEGATSPHGSALPPLPMSPEPRMSPSMAAARAVGSAMMSALHSSYNPFRLLHHSQAASPGAEHLMRGRTTSEEALPAKQQAGGAAGMHWAATSHEYLVSRVRDVLLWRDAGASARAFGLGLYSIICLRHLPKGLDYLHPVTALCCACLLYLVYNVAWRMIAGRHMTPEALAARSARLEVAIYEQVAGRLMSAASLAAHLAAALAVLLHRLLQGRRLGATFWTVVSLWGLVLLGEARLLSHSWLAGLAYITAFSLPWAYVQCRRAMDAFVADSVHWALGLVLGANRLGAAMALLAAGLILSWGSLGLVLRASLAAAVSLSILAWQNGFTEAENDAAAALMHKHQQQQQQEQQQQHDQQQQQRWQLQQGHIKVT